MLLEGNMSVLNENALGFRCLPLTDIWRAQCDSNGLSTVNLLRHIQKSHEQFDTGGNQVDTLLSYLCLPWDLLCLLANIIHTLPTLSTTITLSFHGTYNTIFYICPTSFLDPAIVSVRLKGAWIALGHHYVQNWTWLSSQSFSWYITLNFQLEVAVVLLCYLLQCLWFEIIIHTLFA